MRLDPVISLMAFATVLAVSCVKTQMLPDGARDRQAITFTTAVGPQGTKAVIEGNGFPKEHSFATLAWWLEEGNWDSDRSNAQLYIPLGTVVSYDEDLKCWTTGTPYYWPSRGSLTFFSFYPHDMPESDGGGSGVSVTKDGVQLDNWNVLDDDGKPKNIDFMVADPAKDLTATGAAGGVPTLFRHTMTRVRVNIIDDGSSESEIEITSITLNDIYCTGSYAAGSWGSTSERSNLNDISLPLPATTIGAGLRTDYVIMLPQNLLAVSDNEHDEDREAPSMTIIYSNPADPGTTTANIKFADWLGSSYWTAGHDITYTVTFGSSTDPIDFGAEVGDWTDIEAVTVSGQ